MVEEIVVGVRKVLEVGVFNGVFVIFGMYNKLDLFVGIIGVKEGLFMVSVD